MIHLVDDFILNSKIDSIKFAILIATSWLEIIEGILKCALTDVILLSKSGWVLGTCSFGRFDWLGWNKIGGTNIEGSACDRSSREVNIIELGLLLLLVSSHHVIHIHSHLVSIVAHSILVWKHFRLLIVIGLLESTVLILINSRLERLRERLLLSYCVLLWNSRLYLLCTKCRCCVYFFGWFKFSCSWIKTRSLDCARWKIQRSLIWDWVLIKALSRGNKSALTQILLLIYIWGPLLSWVKILVASIARIALTHHWRLEALDWGICSIRRLSLAWNEYFWLHTKVAAALFTCLWFKLIHT